MSITSRLWSPLIAEPVRQHADVLTIGSEYRTQQELLRAALRDADVVVTWGGGNYWPLPTQAPVVMVAHGSCQWTRDAVAKAIAGGASHVVGVSETASEAIRDLCGDVPVTTIWNGVDPARLQVTRSPDDIRTNVWKVPQHWYAHQRKYVGYVGRLSPEKNVESVIEAVAQLPSYYYCVLIGDTGEAKERILALGCRRLGERLIAVPAVDDVGNHLAALDCLVASVASGGELADADKANVRRGADRDHAGRCGGRRTNFLSELCSSRVIRCVHPGVSGAMSPLDLQKGALQAEQHCRCCADVLGSLARRSSRTVECQ